MGAYNLTERVSLSQHKMVRKCLNSQSIRFIPIFSHQMKAQTRKKFDAYQSTVASVANVKDVKDDPARPLFSGFKAGKVARFSIKLFHRKILILNLHCFIRHSSQSLATEVLRLILYGFVI